MNWLAPLNVVLGRHTQFISHDNDHVIHSLFIRLGLALEFYSEAKTNLMIENEYPVLYSWVYIISSSLWTWA
jgi:hypothetical protein